MKYPLSRRQFVARSMAAGTAATFIPSTALGRGGSTAPNDRIQLVMIGIGPRCTYDLKAMLPFSDIKCVAITDVQANRRNAGKQLVDKHYGNSDCKIYRDFREVLDRKDVDAVLIATGDRWHGPASILAAEAGKDVYGEKPCGLTIATCQQLSETFERTKRIFQAGTQRRGVPNFIKAVDWVHSGKLGKLHTMHASVYFPSLDIEANLLRSRPSRDWTM